MISEELLHKYNADIDHGIRVENLSLQLFDAMAVLKLHKMSDKKRRMLSFGAALHDIGYFVSAQSHNKHSADIIKKEPLDFDEEDKKIIACVARYHRGSLPQNRHGDFSSLSPKKQKTVMRLGGIVRLADAICKTGASEISLKYFEGQNILWIKIPSSGGNFSPAQSKKDLLEKAFGVQVVVLRAGSNSFC